MTPLKKRPNHPDGKPNWISRLGRIVLWIVAVFGSLISFPNVFPWVLSGWLAYYSYLSFRQRTSWLPLAICLALIAIKLPEPTLWLLLFAIVLILQLWNPNFVVQTRTALPWICWAVYATSFWWGKETSFQTKFESGRPVVCLGDSLTDYGYPQELEKLISAPVRDFGFNGYTTSDAIKLLPEIVAVKPQAVIIELGGHDYNKDHKPRSATLQNLEQIIDECQESGARIVLVEIPRGFITDPYYGLERQLARQYDLQLIPDSMIRNIVFWSPIIPPGSWVDASWRNSDDGLHPNDRGNKMMAAHVATALADVFGDEILTSDE